MHSKLGRAAAHARENDRARAAQRSQPARWPSSRVLAAGGLGRDPALSCGQWRRLPTKAAATPSGRRAPAERVKQRKARLRHCVGLQEAAAAAPLAATRVGACCLGHPGRRQGPSGGCALAPLMPDGAAAPGRVRRRVRTLCGWRRCSRVADCVSVAMLRLVRGALPRTATWLVLLQKQRDRPAARSAAALCHRRHDDPAAPGSQAAKPRPGPAAPRSFLGMASHCAVRRAPSPRRPCWRWLSRLQRRQQPR